MAPESDPGAAAGWGAAGQRQPRAPLLGPQPRPAFVIRVGPSCLRWAVPGAGSEDSGEEATVRPPGQRRRASPGPSEHFARVNSGAPAEAALHAGVPCPGGQGAALTPPPPGSPSRSLLLEAAGQVGGRGGLWGPLSPPQPRPSRVSGRGVGQTSGVRSQLLPPRVSSEQRTRLPGPRLPM